MIPAFPGRPRAIARRAISLALPALLGTLAGCPPRRSAPAIPMDGPFPAALSDPEDWEPLPADSADVAVPVPGRPTSAEPSTNGAPPPPAFAAAVASLLAEPGPDVLLRFFLPAPDRSEHPGFDADLEAIAFALADSAPRLARVDVTWGPFDDNAVTSMRGTGILPRVGGDPESVRALLVAVGGTFTPVQDLAASRGSAAMQVFLSLHRIVRGPSRIGVVVPERSSGSFDRLAGALPNFEVVPAPSDGAAGQFGAVVVVASGEGPLPAAAEALVRDQLASGRGVVVLGGPLTVAETQPGMRVERSRSDPTSLLALAGLAFEPGLVLDPDCARVSVPAASGRMFLSYPPMVRTRVRFPGGAGDAIGVLPFASPVRTAGVPGAAEILAESSAAAWVERGAVDLDPNRTWRAGEETGSRSLVVAVTLPPHASGAAGGRFVVVPTSRIVDPASASLEANTTILAALVAWAARVDELLLIGMSETEVNEP